MKASLLSTGVLSSILGSRMVFGMIPGFYDYKTFIESFLRFEPGTNFGCGRRIDQLAILAFLNLVVDCYAKIEPPSPPVLKFARQGIANFNTGGY